MIVQTKPPVISPDTFSVLVYSDAESDIEAVKEISDWAHANGFIRTREAQVPEVLQKGKRYFKGFCYRKEEEDIAAAAEFMARVRKNREAMPMTRSSVELRREED